jgi:hypothetical protein
LFNETHLIGPLAAMALLVLVVGIRLFSVRVSEMRQKRVRPQAVATSLQMTAALERVQAADNFKNLFELPVLFLCAVYLRPDVILHARLVYWRSMGVCGPALSAQFHSLYL